MTIQEIKVFRRGETDFARVYRYEGISEEEAERLAKLALRDPATQEAVINEEADDGLVEIGYKSGVSDPMEQSLLRAAWLLGINPTAVNSSIRVIEGLRKPSQIEMVIEEKPSTLVIGGESGATKKVIITQSTRAELEQLSVERGLFLNQEEMGVIQKHYQILDREPTEVELEMLAQTWSEHNQHKTFKAILIDDQAREKPPLFERIKKTSQKYFDKAEVVSAFEDNAGGISFFENWAIVAKGETHNSPVAIDPYGGALTKSGGLFRDIAGCGQGGVNLVALMINNFGPPEMSEKEIPPGCLKPVDLLLNNSRGEREYGNPMGIPTQIINLHFHPDFAAKPTSLGVAIGLVPLERVKKGRPNSGDLIVSIGGKTGKDGIHGATFSSGEMTEKTALVHANAVQLGDPIMEKTIFDALTAARDENLIRALTDCGGGGYSSAIGEMAETIGAEVYLDRIPQKYAGISAWELWLSESQERMVVAVDPENWSRLDQICRLYEAPATVIGQFSDDRRLRLYHGDETVADMEMEFLHRGLPQRRMRIRDGVNRLDWREPKQAEEALDYLEKFKSVLSHWNICSKEEMQRQYDQTVQSMTVLASLGGINQDVPNEAIVIAPFIDRDYGVVVAYGVNPLLTRIDPYWGSVWSFALAASRLVAAGGKLEKAAGVDNFIWPYPDPESLGDLDKAVDGLCRMMELLEIPMVSGKDSLSSTYKGAGGLVVKAPPSLNVTLFGGIENIEKTISGDIKKIGSVICLLGKMDQGRLGGSVYFQSQGLVDGPVPRSDLDELPLVLRRVTEAIQRGEILSARAVGEGGLAASLALMCFGGDCGVRVELNDLASRADYALFNETAGCLVVEVESEEKAAELFKGVGYVVLGKTLEEKVIKASFEGEEVLAADIDELKKAWQQPMKNLLNG